ncbi:glycosyltransferase [Desulfuromonas sp. TF]|uniref:glycosyltransferase n=1 Tax=Desulfuromonas sp. TF TaxID=1232410 RepID=UPI000417FBAA|nr:glycosyltransferase [Desulfuromonas sp. TF]
MRTEVRGAYIARLDLGDAHLLGVAKKIRAQMAALSGTEQSMDLFYPTGGEIRKNGEVLRSYGASHFWRRLTYYYLFYLCMARQPLDANFIYIRYQRSSPLFLYLLSRIKARHPGIVVLVELPSYPYHTEWHSFRDRLFGLIDRLSIPFLRYYVDRIITFSREGEIFGIPTIRTDNGVDVDAFGIMPRPEDSEVIRLVGVANLSFWHGYDRIISGLARHYAGDNPRPVVFEIVGSGQELERLQNDARRNDLTEHVTFHGPLHGAELDEVLGRCHIGVSSIGMHRLQVDTSNLKSREFCARGIPFVIAYEDRDFSKELEFVFHVSANDEPVDITKLLEFYDALRIKNPDFTGEMRKYAEERLTWRGKMKPVAETVRELLTTRS